MRFDIRNLLISLCERKRETKTMNVAWSRALSEVSEPVAEEDRKDQQGFLAQCYECLAWGHVGESGVSQLWPSQRDGDSPPPTTPSSTHAKRHRSLDPLPALFLIASPQFKRDHDPRHAANRPPRRRPGDGGRRVFLRATVHRPSRIPPSRTPPTPALHPP